MTLWNTISVLLQAS